MLCLGLFNVHLCERILIADVSPCNVRQGDRGGGGERGLKGIKGDMGDPGLSGQPVSDIMMLL